MAQKPKDVTSQSQEAKPSDVNLEALLKRLEDQDKKIQELEESSGKAIKAAREAQDTATKTEARASLQLSDSIAYPSGKRPSKFADFEAMFKKYGVGTKPLKFIRKRYTGDMVLPSQDTVTYKGQIIRLLYCTNHESPFIEDHPNDPNWNPETRKIVFKHGANESFIIALPSDPCLQRYLLISSKNGSLYELEDKEAIAEKELQRLEEVYQARTYINKLFEDKDENAARKFGVFVVGVRNAIEMSLKELKLALYSNVDANPRVVEDYKQNEHDCEIKFTYGLAESRGILIVKGNSIVNWTNTRIGSLNGLTPEEAFVVIAKETPHHYAAVKQRVGE